MILREVGSREPLKEVGEVRGSDDNLKDSCEYFSQTDRAHHEIAMGLIWSLRVYTEHYNRSNDAGCSVA